MTEFANHWLDKLAELVPQDKADQAVELANRVRSGVASALREATEAVDPAPDQREELAAAKVKVEELEDALQKADTKLDEFTLKLDEAGNTLVSRGHEINLLNDTIRQKNEELAAYLDAAKARTSTPRAPTSVA